MKSIDFINRFVDKFDTPKKTHFKLDCVQSKNVYILLTNVINFKLRLINFVQTCFRCRHA